MKNKKQSFTLYFAMLSTLIVNSVTSVASPLVRPNPPSYGDHRPGYNRPVPVRPNPIRPTPIRPIPRPIRPVPVPVPVPVYPVPPVYPQPIYPSPVYPGPYDPPYYPDPSVQRTIYLNRYLQYESINLTSLMGLNYNYEGYRVRYVHVIISDSDGAQVDLLINHRVVDSRNTYGGDVYLYPNYQDQLYYEISNMQLGVTGRIYVNRITVELERY